MFDESSPHRLVGKFFTDSIPPSFEETEQSLRKQWVLSGELIIQKVDDGDTFLFEFRLEDDKKRVLETGHINVNGVIMVIKDPNSSETIDFTVSTFKIVVVGLPSYLYRDRLRTLKYLIGGRDPVLHVYVDLKKPLEAGFHIDQNPNRFVQFKYFNLGDFCYNCGMISHVQRNCVEVTLPKERPLNATSRTHVYGPWLRVPNLLELFSYELVPMKSPEKQDSVRECEKTLSYAQFFIEIEFNSVIDCSSKLEWTTKSTHRFRFPCSYLDIDTAESKGFSTCKAYEVIRREIHENTPFPLGDFGDNPDTIGSLLEQLKLDKKNEFCCHEAKWLIHKFQINLKYAITHVDYETKLARRRELLTESMISDLIKKRVENNENLLDLSSWEDEIREVILETDFIHYMHHSYVSRRANQAIVEAIQMEMSLSSCMIPADKSTVLSLEQFKVLGPDMDRLNPCVICVEEMFLAEEATRLPCSHVFHSSCIDKWFEVGHKCPLCGFKLPLQK